MVFITISGVEFSRKIRIKKSEKELEKEW